MTTQNSQAAHEYCQTFLQENNYPYYLSTLFLPSHIRHFAQAIYVFDAEISNIAGQISQPMPGEIRIQWWRDLVNDKVDPSGNPIAIALIDTVKTNKLEIVRIDSLLAARIFDFYQDPMPDTDAAETYWGETRSVLFFLITSMMRASTEKIPDLSEACGHAGVYCGIVDRLTKLPQDHHQKRSYFAQEISTYEQFLDQPGSDTGKIINPDWLKDVTNYANHHLSNARKAIAQLPKEIRSAFLPLAIANLELNFVTTSANQISQGYLGPSRLRMNWCLWKAAITGKF